MLWYAEGVLTLQARPIKDRTSWRYLAAMHGIDAALWTAFGYLSEADKLPTKAEQGAFWNQCQHQSWYFLPWHRGYLAAFEAIMRAAIVAKDGPSDWALPYWNYNATSPPSANTLPHCFEFPTMPDGRPNPLAVKQRYGPNGSGKISLHAADIALDALKDSVFTTTASGGSTGFGGRKTRFRHQGAHNSAGMLESQPHN
ncbi:MAG TPA: tyrosinase family protein, partial [Rhizobacter sp.]|nr:tyrosinase family protein [Rhizobacter sp.]